MKMQQNEKRFVYVSSWNKFTGNPGIGLYQMDAKTGELEFLRMENETLCCGFSFVDKKRNVLYITNETDRNPDYPAAGGGFIYAFRINRETGALTELCHAATYCPDPCYMNQDKTGKFLIVANHSSRSAVTKIIQQEDGKYGAQILYDDAVINLYELDEEGKIFGPLDVVKHVGGGTLPDQLHAMPHTVLVSPDGQFVAVCDIGQDKIYMYKINYEKRKLELVSDPYQDVPGSCPRYCQFHPTEPYLYVNHENSKEGMNVIVLKYNSKGNLELTETVNAAPEGFEKKQGDEQQGLVLHPSGNYLYDIVKGPDIVTVFSVSQDGKILCPIQYQKIEGVWPRGCTVTEDGRFLLTTCLISGDIHVFSIQQDGKLVPVNTMANQSAAADATIC